MADAGAAVARLADVWVRQVTLEVNESPWSCEVVLPVFFDEAVAPSAL